MRKKKNSRKLMVKVMALILILLLIVLGLVVTIDRRTADDDQEEANAVTENQTEGTDDLSEGVEESASNSTDDTDSDVGDEEAQPQQLISNEMAQEMVKNDEGAYTKSEAVTSGKISVKQFASFNGQYVEDGRDELVDGVASILVKNDSGKFLELAILVYEIGDETGTFVVSSLPAGKSAWVMEKSKLIINGDEKFKHQGSTTSFKEDAIASSKKLKITSDGNMLTAENQSDKTMKNLAVYYKVKHDDGNYFGGITYVVDFGDLKAGESFEKLAGHYNQENSDIVRISWQ